MALRRAFFAGGVALALTFCGVARSATIFDNPANQLADPAILASQTPHSAAYVASNVFDGIFGSGNGEYATTNAIAGDAFIDFDFGAPQAIGGFVFYQRLGGADGVTGFQLVFDDNSDFSTPLATKTFATSGVRDFTLLNDSAGSRQQFEFPSGVNAQYVRWDVVSAIGNGYDGAAEMEFWTGVPVPEPSAYAMAVAGIACGGFCRLRGRQKSPRCGRGGHTLVERSPTPSPTPLIFLEQRSS